MQGLTKGPFTSSSTAGSVVDGQNIAPASVTTSAIKAGTGAFDGQLVFSGANIQTTLSGFPGQRHTTFGYQGAGGPPGFSVVSGGGYTWSGDATNSDAARSAGLFQISSGVIAAGNGTPNDTSGTLKARVFSTGPNGGFYANDAGSVYLAGNLNAAGPITPGCFTLATLPSASGNPRALATVSNPAAGKRADVLSDGTNWRYPDNSIAA